MDCKNCSTPITDADKFCSQCGGKIIRERITFKTLIYDAFLKALGWDSKYFMTVRKLVIEPEVILKAYIDGVRKRYVNPIAFFAIGMTISLIIFNVFQHHYLELSGVAEVEVSEDLQLPSEPIVSYGSGDRPPTTAEQAKMQAEIGAWVQKTILKYFNVYSFCLLPLYAFMSFMVFGRKRNNYTEQLVINAYLQGLLFLSSTLFFLLTLYGFHWLYQFGFLLAMAYSTYAYGRLYKFGFWKSLLFLLKFIGFLIAIIIVLMIIIVGIGFVLARIQGN